MLPGMTVELHIPDTMTGCQTLIAELTKTVTEGEQKIASLQQQIETLQLEMAELLRRAFQKRSERYLQDPGQLSLDFGNTPEAVDAAAGLAEAVLQAGAEAGIEVKGHTRRKKDRDKPRNEQLPAHLPRYEVQRPIPADVRFCATHGERQIIGHDRMETLEYERPKLRVRVTLIPKLAVREGGGVRRESARSSARVGGRQPLRHVDRRGNHHGEIRLSSAVLSPAGLVRRQWVDTQPRNTAQHRDGGRRLAAAAHRLLSSGSAGERGRRHGRHARHAAIAFHSADARRRRSEVAADSRRLLRRDARQQTECHGRGCGRTAVSPCR